MFNLRHLFLASALVIISGGCGPQLEGEDLGEFEGAAVDPRYAITDDLNINSNNQLDELSGMAASTAYPGFVWMHRDGNSNDRPSREYFYAMKVANRALVAFTGSSGKYPTRGWHISTSLPVENINWEDMAVGLDVTDNAGQSIYIGDIGNNNGTRLNYQIYQFAEPNPTSTPPKSGPTEVTTLQHKWLYKYPPGASRDGGKTFPNCETLFLLDRNLYIITKEMNPRVYRFPANFWTFPESTNHTLVVVANGSRTEVVNGVAGACYGRFSSNRQRFVFGTHAFFRVFVLGANSYTGDELVRRMLLTTGVTVYQKDVGVEVNGIVINTEAATFENGTNNVILGTEKKRIYHWPASNYGS